MKKIWNHVILIALELFLAASAIMLMDRIVMEIQEREEAMEFALAVETYRGQIETSANTMIVSVLSE